MDLYGRIYSLLGGWRDLCQRMREAEMERGDERDRDDYLLRQIDKAK